MPQSLPSSNLTPLTQPSQSNPPLQTRKMCGFAWRSLLAGLLGFTTLMPFFILAIILGHISLRRIRKNSELTGEGLARAGLIIGYLGTGLSLVILAFIAWIHFGRG